MITLDCHTASAKPIVFAVDIVERKPIGCFSGGPDPVFGPHLPQEIIGSQKVIQPFASLDAGEREASAIFEVMNSLAADAESSVVPTDDDGLALEFSSESTGRDLLFAIPRDGSVRYFTARGPGGFRRAGIVKDDLAFAQLAQWLENPNSDFSSLGLDVG